MERLALEAIGITKAFGARNALCGVDLVARHGELHGLLGPNGAGKTTLMRVLLGLVRRDAGTAQLLGHTLDAAADGVPDGVAGLIEVPAFYPYLSARKNLALLARLDTARGSADRPGVDAALEQTGLTAQADVAVGAYSAGMRQRLGLASALLRSPRLLFLDEPTSSLDPAGARDVRALARRLADDGAAVVLSSHDMTEVEELCTTVTIINHGRVVFSGAVDELRTRASAAIHALHTSDDGAACALASRWPRIKVAHNSEGGLAVSADVDALDAYVIALGRAGVAVRSLEKRARTLESLFLELTADPDRRKAPVVTTSDDGAGVHDLEAVS
ncbi:MAG TPA: ABC transporter ATP-binding protein [Vicinamibacterales bacterium]|nr:ABC transporter ATP-binding protein [Vicinamibacterales bacterium]